PGLHLVLRRRRPARPGRRRPGGHLRPPAAPLRRHDRRLLRGTHRAAPVAAAAGRALGDGWAGHRGARRDGRRGPAGPDAGAVAAAAGIRAGSAHRAVRGPMTGDPWTPANDVERELRDAADAGDTSRLLAILAVAPLVLPGFTE